MGKFSIWRIMFDALGLAAVGAIVYVILTNPDRFPIQRLFRPPCTQPITYSLGAIGPKFGISREGVSEAVRRAADIWEIPAGRELFKEVPNHGEITVNLIYDSRQKAAQAQGIINETITNEQSAYDTLKKEYDAAYAAYLKKKDALDPDIRAAEAQRDIWNAKIDAINARGGATKEEYDALQREKANLNQLFANLNARQSDLNADIKSLNSMTTELNRLINTLKLNVETYNAIGQTNGPEFDEGQYVHDANGERIDIFQYNTKDMLIRVLAHELGHALGLEHTNDPNGIMYELNIGKANAPTETDIAELKQVCRMK